MKKGYLNNFVNWILDKLATKVYNQLATSNKTMIGALNELNNLLKTQIIDTRSTNKPPQLNQIILQQTNRKEEIN